MSKEFDLIEKAITNAYRDRYKGLEFPRTRRKDHPKSDPTKISKTIEIKMPDKPLELEDQKKIKTSPETPIDEMGHELRDGTLIVEWETFQNLCLEALVGTLGKKLNLLHLKDDNQLSNYLYTTFGNLLQAEINKLTPGLETRVKQIKKILTKSCHQIEVNKLVCWKLKNVSNKAAYPAGLDRLEETIQTIKAPELQYSKNRNAQKGPSIASKVMEAYLLDLLQEIGGAVVENDLIAFIKKVYRLDPIKQVGFSAITGDTDGGEEISEEEWLSYKFHQKGDLLFNPDHHLMAQELFERFTPRMKDGFYFINIKEIGVKKASKKMKCSTGTITNITNDIFQIFFDYFNSDNNPQATEEEVLAVNAIVADLILEEKENR